jgi:hypothetical protein
MTANTPPIPSCFQGFFEGASHRTYIPNQFFTQLLPSQPLSVLKVVGTIIRFSIGFEVKRGFRRQQVALSYSAIQRYTQISSRQDLASAIKHALASKFIKRTHPGCFDRDAGRQSQAATYGIQWAAEGEAGPSASAESNCRGGSESVPVRDRPVPTSSPKPVLGREFRNRTGHSPVTVSGRKTVPV